MWNKIIALLLVLAFFIDPYTGNAQQKYALLIGINKYYEKPGVLHPRSLQGSVNDARSMQALLTDRFGYKPANIKMILDGDASRDNVANALNAMLAVCKPGDAFVFYFSGHGVWATDTDNRSDPVKRGMNQAMVMSNLYAPGYGCLFTDALVKTIFNRFVDKKVVVTTIFDCCYSGSMAMIPFEGHNAYRQSYFQSEDKSIEIPGAALFDYRVYSGLYGVGDSLTTMLDMKLEESSDTLTHTNAIIKAKAIGRLLNYPDSTGVSDTTGNYNYAEIIKELALRPPPDTVLASRAFNLKDALQFFDPTVIPRPSERLNSRFASLSATTDIEKGIEITDLDGVKHGAFTNALLTVYKKNPADISLDQLTRMIDAEMKKQRYEQTPVAHMEPSRLGNNFLGIPPAGFSNVFTARSVSIKSNVVAFDKGFAAGLSKGNYLRYVNAMDTVIVQVDSLGQYSASGRIKKGSMSRVKPGSVFTRVNGYIKTRPFIKVYIPKTTLSVAAFNDFFTKTIEPVIPDSRYRDLKDFDTREPLTYEIFFQNTAVQPEGWKDALSAKNTYPFFIFLPIPSTATTYLTGLLQKSKNVQLVNSRDKADYILCLNYIKQNEENKRGLVLSLQTFNPGEISKGPGYDVYDFFTEADILRTPDTNLSVLEAPVAEMISKAARGTAGSDWINDY